MMGRKIKMNIFREVSGMLYTSIINAAGIIVTRINIRDRTHIRNIY